MREQLATPLPLLSELAPVVSVAGAPTASPPSPSAPQPRTGGPLPDWMAGHLPVDPPRPAVTFAGHRPFFAVVLLILATLSAVAVAVAVVTPWGPPASVGGVGGLAIAYRRRPELLRKRQARRRHHQLMREYGEPRATLTRLERERDEFEKDAATRATSFAEQQRKLQEGQQAQIARIDRRTERSAKGIDGQIADALPTRDHEVARELRAAQDQTESSCWSDPRAMAAHFVLPNGRKVRVEGIGEMKAKALDAWRTGHVDRARRTQPQQLSADLNKAITDRFRSHVRDLNARRSKAHADADAEKYVVTAWTAAARTALVDDQRRANLDIATRRAEIDQQIKAVMASASAGLKMVEEAGQDLADYRLITFWRFIGFALTGR